MAQRSLNKVILIGNLTRDPELRYTPQGTAVCTFGLATNRSWVTEGGEKKEETEFHRIVAWNKLAELCSQLLFKGRKVYIEGRLQTRRWTGPDGSQKQAVEIVANDMMILDSKRATEEVAVEEPPAPEEVPPEAEEEIPADEGEVPTASSSDDQKKSGGKKKKDEEEEKEVKPEDIPF